MNKKNLAVRAEAVAAAYAAFSIISLFLALLMSKHRVMIMQSWYIASCVFWMGVITAVMICIFKLSKIRCAREEIKRRKE